MAYFEAASPEDFRNTRYTIRPSPWREIGWQDFLTTLEHTLLNDPPDSLLVCYHSDHNWPIGSVLWDMLSREQKSSIVFYKIGFYSPLRDQWLVAENGTFLCYGPYPPNSQIMWDVIGYLEETIKNHQPKPQVGPEMTDHGHPWRWAYRVLSFLNRQGRLPTELERVDWKPRNA